MKDIKPFGTIPQLKIESCINSSELSDKEKEELIDALGLLIMEQRKMIKRIDDITEFVNKNNI